jgi:hypothetical protein
MRTVQQDAAEHGQGHRGSGCCGRASRDVEETATARRRDLEAHQRDLEQELADVAQQLRDLPADEPAADE